MVGNSVYGIDDPEGKVFKMLLKGEQFRHVQFIQGWVELIS